MSKLSIFSLRCLRQQDVVGIDEPRLVVDGRSVWNGALDKGQAQDWNPPLSVRSDGTSVVAVEEMNGDDPRRIGEPVTITAKSSSPAVFKTAGAHYELHYRLTS
jgi:hypothetical protein